MKKKIGIAALVATLSAAFICSSLTPAFAAADTNTNSTVSIPHTLDNGKEIAVIFTKDEARDKYEIEIDDGNLMILYTDNTYDIVKVAESKMYNYNSKIYKAISVKEVLDNIDSVHVGWFEPQQTQYIEIEYPWDISPLPHVNWDDLNPIGKDSLNRNIEVSERIYEIFIDSKSVCKTDDPEVVKSYGFIGKKNDYGHYVGWVYQENANENTDDILVEYNEKQDKPREVPFKIVTGNDSTKPQGSTFIKKGEKDICITAKGYAHNKANFINGVIIESGELPDPEEPTEPEEPVTPVEPVDPVEPTEPDKPVEPTDPTEPEEPVTPVEPTDPEEPVTPVEPEEPKEPSIVTITAKEHDENAKETVMLVFRLPLKDDSKDDTEITTPTVDIATLEAEVIEAERIASEARAEADRLESIAAEKRAALEAARQ